jgi:hypothetical protein
MAVAAGLVAAVAQVDLQGGEDAAVQGRKRRQPSVFLAALKAGVHRERWIHIC